VEAPDSSRAFAISGSAYDTFMGRYSVPLAARFVDAAGVSTGDTALDVGCGPGALTGVLVERIGRDAVAACDPSPTFHLECAARHPGVVVRPGRAESIPFETDRFDHALAQLVLHFVSDPVRAAREMARVVRPGGTVAACVWDFEDGMDMLRGYWDAALTVDPGAPDEARTMRFGRRGEIAELFAAAGMCDIRESTLPVSSTYASFSELWDGFMAAVGPAGAHCASLTADDRTRLRDVLFDALGSPTGSIDLAAHARCAVGRVV
jgi:SAM-dependent methyltransferase